MNKNINIIYIFIMGPKRKQEPRTGTGTGAKTVRTRSPTRSLTPPLPPSDDDSDATASLLGENEGLGDNNEGPDGTTQLPPNYNESDDEEEEEADEEEADEEEAEEEEEAESEEEGLSQEDKDLLSHPLFQDNEDAEKVAINGVVEGVQDSQSQGELSQSQSQEVIQAIGSHGCEQDE